MSKKHESIFNALAVKGAKPDAAGFIPFDQNLMQQVMQPPADDDKEFFAETAMCMWEQALSLFNSDDNWKAYVEGNGYGQARLDIIAMVDKLDEDWLTVQNDYTYCFDWDFVPDWMAANIIFDDVLRMSLRDERVVPLK